MGTLTQFKPSGLSYLGWAHHHFSRGNDDPGALRVYVRLTLLHRTLPSRRLKLIMALTIPYLGPFTLNFRKYVYGHQTWAR
jgi:hypothetical protein